MALDVGCCSAFDWPTEPGGAASTVSIVAGVVARDVIRRFGGGFRPGAEEGGSEAGLCSAPPEVDSGLPSATDDEPERK